MPLLKDYIGALVSGLNQARAIADAESASIARHYASDTLLQNFSIPRFRASNIELSIPIAIDKIEQRSTRDYQPIDNKTFNSVAYSIVKDILKVDRFKRTLSKKLIKKIAAQTDILEKSLKADEDTEGSLETFSIQLSKFIEKQFETTDSPLLSISLGERSQEQFAERMSKTLNQKLRSHITLKQKTMDINNTPVIVEAEYLREIPQESIVRIKMTLVEEGMEWVKMEQENGEIGRKLVAE